MIPDDRQSAATACRLNHPGRIPDARKRKRASIEALFPGRSPRSVLAIRHFHQVVSELRADRPLDHANRSTEDDLVEFTHHLAAAEGAQVAAVAAGGAVGVLAGDCGEIGAAFDVGLQLQALLFGVDQDVAGGCLGHGFFLRGIGWWLSCASVSQCPRYAAWISGEDSSSRDEPSCDSLPTSST